MANVPYQSYKPAAPDPQTVIKTSGDNTTGHIQHVALGDTAGLPMVETRVNTGVRALTVAIGPTDPISDMPVFIDYDHHQVHEGEAWHYDELISNLASGSSYDIVFTVPNITIPAGSNAVSWCPHLRYEFNSNDLCNFFFYEAPTVTAATGAARTAINFERNGTYTALMTILAAPTITVVGTLIDAEYFITASTNQNNPNNRGSSVHEFVLKNNTKYLFRVTSGATGCDIHVDFSWYEDKSI